MSKAKNGPKKTCPVCGKPFASIFKTCSRKCGNANVKSPYQERAKGRVYASDDHVIDARLVVNLEQLAAFDAMPRPKQPPRKREPEQSHAAVVAARKDRNGVA